MLQHQDSMRKGMALLLICAAFMGYAAAVCPAAVHTAQAETAAFVPDPGLQAYTPDAQTAALLLSELRGGFNYFWDTANTHPGSKGYGLIPDRMPSNPQVSSIAAVGYGLAACCIGAERGFVAREDAEARALGTMRTLRDHAAGQNGFFYHFLDMQTGARCWNCELSVIDTCICINGALAAGAYFGGACEALARELYERVEWPWYQNPDTGWYYMGYRPESGFFGAWDMTAEQLMMYFLGAGSPTHPIDGSAFYRFARPVARYGSGPAFIHSPIGSLFVYQFSHLWFDLRGYRDANGADWYTNSVSAALANRLYAIDSADLYGTGPEDWGFSACDGPRGYSGDYGAPPSQHYRNDGTIATHAAAASLPFIPSYAAAAVSAQYRVPGLAGDYGLKDAYNKANNGLWIAGDTLGLNKGASLIMIENYLTGFIWKLMDGVRAVQLGMENCGLCYTEPPVSLHHVILSGGRRSGDTLDVLWDTYPYANILVRSVQWYRSASPSGADAAPIAGANALSYTLQPEDTDSFVLCELTGLLDGTDGYTELPPVRSHVSVRIVR